MRRGFIAAAAVAAAFVTPAAAHAQTPTVVSPEVKKTGTGPTG